MFFYLQERCGIQQINTLIQYIYRIQVASLKLFLYLLFGEECQYIFDERIVRILEVSMYLSKL